MDQIEDKQEVVITPAKPLTSSELEIVKLHKILTECLQQSSNSRIGVVPRPLFGKYKHNPYNSTLQESDEDSNLDSQLQLFFQKAEPSLIPEELFFSNKVEHGKHEVMNDKGTKQNLRDKLINIEMQEEDKTEESDHISRERSEPESLFNEAEYGDYRYSFCEDEDANNEDI